MQENNIDISPIKKRFFEYLDYKGITKYKCYQETGISNSVLSQKNGFSEDSYIKIAKTYTDLNLKWLILGVDNMIVDISNIVDLDSQTTKNVIVKEVTPDFMLKRIENLAIENHELRKDKELLENRILMLEKSKKYDNHDNADLKVAESED